MSPLLLALTVLVSGLFVGPAVYALSDLTANQDAFLPLRQWVSRHGGTDTFALTYRADVSKVARFCARLINCPVCSSFWHAAWVTLLVTLLLGAGWRFGLMEYLSAIGYCCMIDRLVSRPRVEGPLQSLL